MLDSHWNGMPVAVTDISATCHMPDVIEAPYRPAMLGEQTEGEGEPERPDELVRLGGPSCLAGDVIGDYHLPVPAEPGQRIAFLAQELGRASCRGRVGPDGLFRGVAGSTK